ncbi:MAG: glycosyl hydrolase [Kiritimatiellia bacterium]
MRTLFLFLSLAVSLSCLARPTLEEGFLAPPRENRPQVWWWFTEEAPDAAVTRDLEGLARVGVGGFHIYGGDPTRPQWIAKAKWALHEASRLGLEGVVCIGNAGCGHHQTDPRHAQKDVVFTTATATGGGTVRVRLPKKGVETTPKNADGSPKYYWDVAVLAVPKSRDFVPVSAVRDLTRAFDPKTEELTWPDAPSGEWTLLRVGFVPKVFGWMGCYIDHMSRAAFDAHWARVMDPFLAALAPDERRALAAVMCDSWEAGTVSWTDSFPEEFRARRGYDILPWLPAKAGIRLEDAGKQSRFLRDFDETVSELIAENHYAYQKTVANRHGLRSIAEAAGPHQKQGDVRRMQGRCDVAMGEFWMPSAHRPAPPQRFMLRDAATAAHVYGLGEVLAEAFTTINTYWIESPETMKPCADRAFCDGLTRVCYHGMMLSPSLTDRPGRIRNVGTHYNPQTTWFEQSRALNLYLSRCSWMLSQGRFAADALLYAGDAIGVFAGMKAPADALGAGYDYDLCPTELLLRARVEAGEVVLPSGARYKALMLSGLNPKARANLDPGARAIKSFPPVRHPIGEAAMLKLRGLVEAGATLVGPRPDGPTSMNESSARYHAAADALWGPRGSRQAASRAVGRGRVVADGAVVREGLPPDFSVVAGEAAIDWVHRTTPTNEIYFLSNPGDAPQTFTGRFRTALPCAELWDPVTGVRRGVRVDAGQVEISLPRFGSAFVVFGESGRQPEAEAPRRRAQTIDTPWKVSFDPAWGGPAAPVEMPALKDWTAFDVPGIRDYSGTAVYRTTFDAPNPSAAAVLDLGTVLNVAEVVLNGKSLGIVWTSPFALPVGDALRAQGNELEIRVTNLWPNRLIGDSALPEGRRVTHTNINPYKPADARLPSGLLGPVTLR